jgi:hypothetical protein
VGQYLGGGNHIEALPVQGKEAPQAVSGETIKKPKSLDTERLILIRGH